MKNYCRMSCKTFKKHALFLYMGHLIPASSSFFGLVVFAYACPGEVTRFGPRCLNFTYLSPPQHPSAFPPRGPRPSPPPRRGGGDFSFLSSAESACKRIYFQMVTICIWIIIRWATWCCPRYVPETVVLRQLPLGRGGKLMSSPWWASSSWRWSAPA